MKKIKYLLFTITILLSLSACFDDHGHSHDDDSHSHDPKPEHHESLNSTDK